MVPETSLRHTTRIGSLGRASPGLRAAISAAFQTVISPRKIRASTSPFSLRAPPRRRRLTTGTMPETTVGNITSPSRASSLLGAITSEAPKSTWRWRMRAIPAPEPTGS